MTRRILIVDDEPHIRAVMRVTLEHSGYDVGEASSGEEALDLITGEPAWNAVLLDERMPGIDGLETLRRIRQRDPDLVVIMVTAFASIELAVDAMKVGATDFLRKPMTPETLRIAVEAALSKASGEWPPAPAPPPGGRKHRFEIGVLNGFRVTHVSDEPSAAAYRFEVVRGQHGTACPVRVEFDAAVMAEASTVAERPLDRDHAFWRRQAGLALAHHVWTHAEAPAQGTLAVTRISVDIIEAARQPPA